MKFFVSLTLVLLLAGCAAPEDKDAAHQRQLEKEARANFYALRAQLSTHIQPEASPTPAPRRGLFAFLGPRPADSASQSSDTGEPPPPKRKPKATPPSKDDT